MSGKEVQSEVTSEITENAPQETTEATTQAAIENTSQETTEKSSEEKTEATSETSTETTTDEVVQQETAEAQTKESNNRSFFQNNKYLTLVALLIAALTGGVFAAFYFGALTVGAVVTAAAKIGIDLGFLSSMSLLASSATLAGITAGVATVFTTATYAISAGIRGLFNWATQSAPEASSSEEAQNSEEAQADATNEEANKLTTENTAENKEEATVKSDSEVNVSINPSLVGMVKEGQASTEAEKQDLAEENTDANDIAPTIESPVAGKKVVQLPVEDSTSESKQEDNNEEDNSTSSSLSA